MTIICEPDAHRAADLATTLGDGSTVATTLAALREQLIADPGERLVVVGPGSSLADVVPFAAEVRGSRPGTTVLLVRDVITPEEVTASVAAGVHRVLPAGDPRPLLDAVNAARAQAQLLVEEPAALPETPAPSLAAVGQIITVFSPKGGSGKTTVATNLAVSLHGGGARRVCLVDLDLEFGDVAISLRLEPVKSLVDAITTDAPDDEDDAIRMLTTEFRPGLDCILAPIEPGDANKIAPQLISDLLPLLRARYEFVVVDTPSQLSETVLASIDCADELVLITNPEIPALKNLRLTLDMLDLLMYRREARLILFNKADDAAGLTAAEVEHALGAPLAAHIPASRDVPASINKGVPIVALKPEHPVSVAIRAFADQFIAKVPQGAKHGKRSRLFRRHTS